MWEKLQGGVGEGEEGTVGGGEGKTLQNHGKAKGILALTDKFWILQANGEYIIYKVVTLIQK